MLLYKKKFGVEKEKFCYFIVDSQPGREMGRSVVGPEREGATLQEKIYIYEKREELKIR